MLKSTTFEATICKIFKDAGLEKDDKVIFHSNIAPLYRKLKKKYKFNLQDIVEVFLNFFNQGTLAVPAFNFNFCNGQEFDARFTPSQVGSLSEAFRKVANKKRTWHPVYSFTLHGKVPDDYLNFKNYSAFSKKSIFNWLYESNGKIAILDLPDQNSMTFYHFIEQQLNVDWRYNKTFISDYVDFNGQCNKKVKAEIFVRKIEPNYTILTEVSKMQKILSEKKLYITKNTNSSKGMRSIQSHLLFSEVENIIKQNQAEGILYKKV